MSDNSTILVIGDSGLMNSPLCQGLSPEIDCVHASNSDQVIDITSDNDSIDLILVDLLGLADKAYETCMWLKTDSDTRDMPIIVLGDDESQIGHWLSAGAVDYITLTAPQDLIYARLKNLLELKRKTQLLGEIASLDALTAVANKERFDEYLNIEWRRSLREFYPLSLIKLDIDGFAAYNDHYGLGNGDQALRRIARVIENSCNRAADMVSRYGADEFMILLPSIELDNALALAERLVERVSGLAVEHSAADAGLLTVSVGVATIEPSRDKRYQDIFDEAHEVLYRAQQMGGNQAQGIAI